MCVTVSLIDEQDERVLRCDSLSGWHSAARGQDPIDGSHKGPLTTWIAPYSDGIPSGNAWVQVGSEAFHTDTSQWAVTKVR